VPVTETAVANELSPFDTGGIDLDANATTRPLEDVVDLVTSVMRNGGANPSSAHWLGGTARAILERARDGVASLLPDSFSEGVIFTSGGTEGNNAVLINRGLPSHLASALAAKVEQEKDLRCDLVLTHSDQRRLRQIYAEQNVAISARLDGAMASEAAQTFLSRLRVGFIDLGGVGKAEQSVQAADLVFLHDVIARGAKTSWRRIPEPSNGWPPFERSAPDGETRRRPFEKGTRKTESLLVPAERPLEVQQYLDLVRDFHQDFRDAPDGHYVPVREIDFDESGVGVILDQAHRVARWVVTYDAIADLHLFRSNNVDIIRYVPRPDRDHNLVVSTRQPGAMLLAKLSEEIGHVLSVGGKEAEALARVCIGDASAISGRVVLRAARLENNALELLGLVLSRQVVFDSIDPGSVPVCWLLLDDFADRLGHKGRKADILVICLSAPDGVPVIDLVVVESKFTGQDGESAAMAESMEQMRASTTDLRDRIIGTGDVLNRPTWLRRLADLLLEHGSFPGAVGGRDPGEWARIIRSDEASLKIVGLSLVFVHDRLDGVPEPMASPFPEQRQFTFNRDQVAEGLRPKNSLAPPLTSPPCGSPSAAITWAAPASRARHFLKVLGAMP